jgi:DNA polymerase-4
MIGPAGAADPGRGDTPERLVLHVDIDAFFAAVEQARDPRLRGKPVIVGAGVIASCSYEARRFGLRAGMRLTEARRLCPEVLILDGHAQVYRCFAERIFELCREFSPAVETYLDEAYGDLTGTERLHGDPLQAAARLKRLIREATGLTVSCGVGPNRMLAKMAGKLRRPDGLARIHPAQAEAFLVERPIEDLLGVGHTHARTLRSMNVTTIGALRALSAEALEALFGAPGRLLFERCRGRDTAPVTTREIPLSISRETSFHRPTADRGEIEGMLDYLLGRAARMARELGIKPRTVTVRLRYDDGQGDERARTLPLPSDVDPVLLAPALDLLRRSFTRRVPLRLVGVTLSQFARGVAEQGSLLDEAEAGRRAALVQAMDGVRDEFGHGAVVSGRALELKGRMPEDRHGFVLRTPSLTK